MTPQSHPSHTALELLSAHSKMTIDWLKHLMSLSVGIVVLVATFRERIQGKFMVVALPLAIIFLLVAILCAMRVGFDLVYNDALSATVRAWALTGDITPDKAEGFRKEQETFGQKDRQLKRFLLATNLTFAAGVICIVAFVVRNLLAVSAL